MPDVKMPDGTIIRNVPDGTTRAQIQARYQAHVNAQKPKGFWQGVLEEGGKVLSNAQWALDAATGQNLARTITGQPTASDLQRAQLRQQQANSHYQGSTAGHIVGGIAATIPTMLLPGGPLAQGAYTGALLTENPNDTKALARDVATSAAFGKAGSVAAKGLGSLVGGRVLKPAVKKLVDEGITLTPGQLGGPNSVRQFVEDKVLGSIPGLNAIPDSAAIRANNGLRQAVATRVLAPIDQSIPKGMHVDSAAIGHIQKLVYDNYDKAAGALNLQLDPEMALGLSKIVQDAPRLVGKDGADQLAANVSHIADMTNQAPITGQVLKDTLGQIRSVASGSQGEMRNQLWNVHDQLADALERQNPPGLALDFAKARQSVSLLKRMEDAASRPGVTNAEFGPTQLLQAANKTGYGTTMANKANGTAPFMDLADAAAEVMRNKTANSNTVPRGLTAKALGSAGGPLGLLSTVHPVAAAGVGASLLGYIPGVDTALQKLAVERPEVLQQFGRAIEETAPYVGLGTSNYGLLGQ